MMRLFIAATFVFFFTLSNFCTLFAQHQAGGTSHQSMEIAKKVPLEFGKIIKGSGEVEVTCDGLRHITGLKAFSQGGYQPAKFKVKAKPGTHFHVDIKDLTSGLDGENNSDNIDFEFGKLKVKGKDGYQKVRDGESFIMPEGDPKGEGFHVVEAYLGGTLKMDGSQKDGIYRGTVEVSLSKF